jgi:hypothetical protein
MERLADWCNDVKKLDKSKKYDYLFVVQGIFDKYNLSILIIERLKNIKTRILLFL